MTICCPRLSDPPSPDFDSCVRLSPNLAAQESALCDYVSLDYIAQLWRSHVFLDYEWIDSGERAGTGSVMTSPSLPGRRVYLKPLHGGDRADVIAREKIASDLAFDLGVSVPPVVLTKGIDSLYSASLEFSTSTHDWSAAHDSARVRQRLGDMRQVPFQAARGLAFDTWVGQSDHGGDSCDNVLAAASTSGVASLVFLDYATSLGRGLPLPSSQAAPFPSSLLELVDVDELESTVSRIEGLELSTLQDVVGRLRGVPADPTVEGVERGLLGPEGRGAILGLLLERRQHLRTALSDYLPQGE